MRNNMNSVLNRVKKYIQNFNKKDFEYEVLCPISGEVKPLKDAPDEAFAKKYMGDGIVIYPTDGSVYAPTAGKIEFIFPSKHAIGFSSNSGLEYLIHVGFNNHDDKGECFEVFVNPGDIIEAGKLIMKFDLKALAEKSESIATPFVITNLGERKIEYKVIGTQRSGDVVMKIK